MSSDHVVFEPYGIPFVFLTMGWHPDYHRTGDTVRKIDWDLLRRSALVALDAARHLADDESPPAARSDEQMYRTDIETLAVLLDTTLDSPVIRWAPPRLRRSLRTRVSEAEVMLARESIGEEAYRAFARGLFQDIGPVLFDRSMTSQQVLGMLFLNERYVAFPGLTVGVQRKYFAQILKGNMSDGGDPVAHSYQDHAVNDQSLVLQDVGDDRWRLSLAVPVVKSNVRSSNAGRSVAVSWTLEDLAADVYGQQADLIDWCLLRWANTSDDHQGIWQEILGVMTDRWDGFDARPDETLESWLDWWSAKRGYADVSGWAMSLLDSPNPKVAMAAVGAAPKLAGDAGVASVVAMMKDPSTQPALRQGAIWSLKVKHGQAAMLAMVDMLSNTEVVDVNGQRPEMDASWPFYHRTIWHLQRQLWKEQEQEGLNTLGEAARRMLVALAGEDLKKTKAWREWAQGGLAEGK